MADLKAFAEQLVNLTVKEVSELATILKEEYGIEPAAAAVAVAGPAAGGAAGGYDRRRRHILAVQKGHAGYDSCRYGNSGGPAAGPRGVPLAGAGGRQPP